MSSQDKQVLNQGHKEAGSEDKAYCRGDNQIIGRDTEELMDIIRNGLSSNKNTYEIAKDIINAGWKKKRFTDEEIDGMLKVVKED